MSKQMEKKLQHPMYYRWKSMKRRCHYPEDKNYKYYGGRGIFVCDEWRFNFWKYVEDVGLPPSNNMQVDRVDGNKGYERGNVKWVTRQVNQANRNSLSPKKNGLPRGVVWIECRKKFRAMIEIWDKGYFLGYFKTKDEASNAYLKIHLEWFGVLPRGIEGIDEIG